VQDVGGRTTYPMLTHTIYDNYMVTMEVMLEERGLWEAVDTSNKRNKD
jgi:hypothetical protein